MAGLVVKGTFKLTTSPPMSFSDTLDGGKAAAATENTHKRDTPFVDMMTKAS